MHSKVTNTMRHERLVCFAHGRESGPWGTKIRHLADIACARGWAVESPDYSAHKQPQPRIEQLLAMAPDAQQLVLCGSSMGGYVSAMACQALAPDGLFLLAPALHLPGYEGEPQGCPANSVVVHGWRDTIVPVSSAQRFARARRAALHVLDDGHRLVNSLSMIGYLFGELLDNVASTQSRTSDGPR